ncbi:MULTISPECIES: Sec-independent protein translocase subunit TatA [unclassified Pseudoclavibacter]|uniref:Sec-independent protein translocase subunit TatA n=1 Tax=unclassified Pseudoclavibacter TaxID=2615177 RepID=UPI001300F031|nr:MULTISPECIES: Sec-independent protein translocase subunit TatA [unclassified Pseudoclavibacter]KAB1646319.1 twin-arginine translocase TatA/TatE family subunit [Pseudoclavibacter sp. CFCC 14310]KAB1663519.1 twin-arginine translocase TatA/TatE family subunit [Pseudoclavibacter sp. CFCC 13611]
MKPWQIIIIVLVILLLFGAPKLPALAKSLGQSMRIFRKEVKGLEADKAADQEWTRPNQQGEQSSPMTSGQAPAQTPVQQPAPVQQQPVQPAPTQPAEGDAQKNS